MVFGFTCHNSGSVELRGLDLDLKFRPRSYANFHHVDIKCVALHEIYSRTLTPMV